MLGRMRRPSMTSLEQLELERSPSKIIKDDPFSIYENTLKKLKEGSQRCQSLPLEEARNADNSHIESCCSPDTKTTDCSSSDCSCDSSICQSMSFSKEKRNKNISILHLFSKYTTPKSNPMLPDEEAMVVDSVYSSASASPCVNQCQFRSSSEQHVKKKCIDSLVI